MTRDLYQVPVEHPREDVQLAVVVTHLRCRWEVRAGAAGRKEPPAPGNHPTTSVAKLTQREGAENPQFRP